MRKKLQEETLYMVRVGARRPFKWCEDQNGIDADEGVPIARVKARYTEQSPLMRNTTRHASKKGVQMGQVS